MSFFCFSIYIYIHIWTYKDRFGVFQFWLSKRLCGRLRGLHFAAACQKLMRAKVLLLKF